MLVDYFYLIHRKAVSPGGSFVFPVLCQSSLRCRFKKRLINWKVWNLSFIFGYDGCLFSSVDCMPDLLRLPFHFMILYEILVKHKLFKLFPLIIRRVFLFLMMHGRCWKTHHLWMSWLIELRGERLEDWLNKCNYTHFPLSEHKRLQCVTLCFILVWINLLCLTILIGYFSQKNWTCGLLHTRESCLSAWNLMSAIFVEKDDLLKWQCQKKKILFCLPKQSYCTCCPRGLEADDRVDAQLTDFSWVWFKVIFFNHLQHACSHTQSTADSTSTHTHIHIHRQGPLCI